ncbi:chlorophyll a/b-binding protein, partial [Klebsiella pneumoniae]|uniref:chlorophyll a/b-binding protein n=1 Tax=Klebsiella pneumoniae TaxID=573 RepID=UPI0025A1D661
TMAAIVAPSAVVRSTFNVQRPRSRTVMKAGNWLPGSDTPAYLDSLPASYGFDPLGLAKEPASLARFRESEVFHCRWAMLGAAGVLGVEVLGYGNWYDAPLPLVQGGSA